MDGNVPIYGPRSFLVLEGELFEELKKLTIKVTIQRRAWKYWYRYDPEYSHLDTSRKKT